MGSMSREQQIAERRAQIPKLYRGTYDKAIKGKSRKGLIRHVHAGEHRQPV